MKSKTVLVLGVCLVLIVSGCQSGGEGPLTWIDQPLDGETFPIKPLTLQAHASDGDGIKEIEFFVNDESQLIITTGSRRLGDAAMAWTPLEPGVYTISARATDNSGNVGSPASSTITISGQIAQEPAPEPVQAIAEPEETPEEEIRITETPEPLPGPVAIPNQTINCRSGPGTDYQVLAAVSSSQPALIIGRLSNNSWYVVTHPDKQIECWVAANIVQVKGSLDGISIWQPPPLPVKPPEEELPAPPPPETDTKPPTVASVSLSPSTIYQQGCAGYTQTAILTVDVIDLGGVAKVEAAWTGGSVKLTYIGGYSYRATIGPIGSTGSVLIYGSAVDNAGHWTPFSATLTVNCCIC